MSSIFLGEQKARKSQSWGAHLELKGMGVATKARSGGEEEALISGSAHYQVISSRYNHIACGDIGDIGEDLEGN